MSMVEWQCIMQSLNAYHYIDQTSRLICVTKTLLEGDLLSPPPPYTGGISRLVYPSSIKTSLLSSKRVPQDLRRMEEELHVFEARPPHSCRPCRLGKLRKSYLKSPFSHRKFFIILKTSVLFCKKKKKRMYATWWRPLKSFDIQGTSYPHVHPPIRVSTIQRCTDPK